MNNNKTPYVIAISVPVVLKDGKTVVNEWFYQTTDALEVGESMTIDVSND